MGLTFSIHLGVYRIAMQISADMPQLRDQLDWRSGYSKPSYEPSGITYMTPFRK